MFFRRLLLCAFVISSSFHFSSFIPETHASSPLVIGEIAWAGSSLSLADEWIELWNRGDIDLSIAGFSLVGASTQSSIVFPDDAVIPAQGTYLVANYSSDDPKSALNIAPQIVTSTVSLSNTTLKISLLDPNQTIIDEVGNGKTPMAGQSTSPKASMVRQGEEWITTTYSLNFDDGSTDLGTPGFYDAVLPQSDEAPLIESEPENADIVEPEPEVLPDTDVTTTISSNEITEGATSTANTDIETTTNPLEDFTSDPPMEVTDPLEEMPAFSSLLTPEDSVDVPLNETATSTESTSLEQLSQSLSTDLSLEEVSSTGSSSPQDPIEPPSLPSSETSSSSSPTIIPPYELLRLNEFMPQPEGGSEWIEITSLDPNISMALQGIELRDAVGKIFTFATGTIDQVHPFARAILSSAHLNNSGDTVQLFSPEGLLLDSWTYAASHKNQTWARIPDATGTWQETATPTPEAPNSFPLPVTTMADVPAPIASVESPTATSFSSTSTSTTDTNSESSLPSLPSSLPPAIAKTTPKTPSSKKTKDPKPSIKPLAVKASAKSVQSTSQTKTSTKTTKPKTATKAAKSTSPKSPAPKSLSFNMIHDDTYSGIRVSLQGMVNSPPGLLSQRAFILTAPDGRGLQVRVPTTRKLPTFGLHIEITGTLLFTDIGVPYLKIGTKDEWKVFSQAPNEVSIRAIDPLLASAEDAWSLTAATGTVVSIKNTAVTFDVDGVNLQTTIRPVIDYRVQRLSVGDTIRVTGILDTSREEPRLLPRLPTDIEIIKHATPAAGAKAKTNEGWMPFGAAGLVIATTEGVKHLRERRKRRVLEKVLETPISSV